MTEIEMISPVKELEERASERIARKAFGSADWLKVQSQHERFLREIRTLSKEKKAKEIANAIKYLHQNKSDYWLEMAHLLYEMLGDKEKKGLYNIIEPNITKKDFCDKYLNMSYKTVSSYVRVIKNFQDFGFNEEQIRVLGFSKTNDILKKVSRDTVNIYTNKSIEELKELKRSQIYQRKKRTPFENLVLTWERASKEERNKFLRFINEKREDSNMD